MTTSPSVDGLPSKSSLNPVIVPVSSVETSDFNAVPTNLPSASVQSVTVTGTSLLVVTVNGTELASTPEFSTVKVQLSAVSPITNVGLEPEPEPLGSH